MGRPGLAGDHMPGHRHAAAVKQQGQQEQQHDHHQDRGDQVLHQGAARILRRPGQAGHCASAAIADGDVGLALGQPGVLWLDMQILQQEPLGEGVEKGLIDHHPRQHNRRPRPKRPGRAHVGLNQRSGQDKELAILAADSACLDRRGEHPARLG